MKKYLLLFNLILFSLLLSAQMEWAPIEAEWYYSNPGDSEDMLGPYLHYISAKDTVVNERTARVIVSQRDTIIMHEDNGRVYYLFKDKFRLIYDFSANVGDTLIFEFMAPKPESYIYDTTYNVAFEVESITSIDVEGGSIRKYSTVAIEIDSLDYEYMDYLAWKSNYQYYEKFGSKYYFMSKFDYYDLIQPNYMPNVLRCYNDSDIEYQTDWWKLQDKPCDYNSQTSAIDIRLPLEVSLYPNPVYGSLNININGMTSSDQIKISVYSHTGKLLLCYNMDSTNTTFDISNLPQGLYILRISDYNGLVVKHQKIIKL